MEQTSISRRAFLVTGAVAAVGLATYRFAPTQFVAADEKLPAPHDVKIVECTPDGKRSAVVTVPAVIKADAEWKRELPAGSYNVTRHAETEMPFTGKYAESHAAGVYTCICCGTALFASDTKFDSGTGWPSFYQPIAKENVREIVDRSYGMERTAVSCTRCEAHLGHVFNDGPQPTGLRYCMNSVSLNFVRAS